MAGVWHDTAWALHYAAAVSMVLLSTASDRSSGLPCRGCHASQREGRRETPVSPACSPPEREGRQSFVRERPRITFTFGLSAPQRYDLVSLAPSQSVHPIFIRFHVWRRHRASPEYAPASLAGGGTLACPPSLLTPCLPLLVAPSSSASRGSSVRSRSTPCSGRFGSSRAGRYPA